MGILRLSMMFVLLISCCTPAKITIEQRHVNTYLPIKVQTLVAPVLKQHTAGMDNGVLYMDLIGDINDKSVKPLIDMIRRSAGLAHEIVLNINSTGGYVSDGESLSTTLETAGIPSICIVRSKAMSMAMYILQSCSIRVMAMDALLLAHRPKISGTFSGNSDFYEEFVERLRENDTDMLNQISRRLNVSRDYVWSRISGTQDWTIRWREALSIGAVDVVYVTQDNTSNGTQLRFVP